VIECGAKPRVGRCGRLARGLTLIARRRDVRERCSLGSWTDAGMAPGRLEFSSVTADPREGLAKGSQALDRVSECAYHYCPAAQ
jgi:hypothetical protein